MSRGYVDVCRVSTASWRVSTISTKGEVYPHDDKEEKLWSHRDVTTQEGDRTKDIGITFQENKGLLAGGACANSLEIVLGNIETVKNKGGGREHLEGGSDVSLEVGSAFSIGPDSGSHQSRGNAEANI